MLIFSISVFLYYTVWTFLTPFLPPSHPIQSYFPSREWAVRIPALLLIIGISLLFSFMVLVLIQDNKKKKQKKP